MRGERVVAVVIVAQAFDRQYHILVFGVQGFGIFLVSCLDCSHCIPIACKTRSAAQRRDELERACGTVPGRRR